ncbi:hypothetical protein ACYULU_05245 [Breznakiellaceae bacterium SP9]
MVFLLLSTIQSNLDPQNKNEEKSTTKDTKGTKGRSLFLSSFVFLVYFVVKFFFMSLLKIKVSIQRRLLQLKHPERIGRPPPLFAPLIA